MERGERVQNQSQEDKQSSTLSWPGPTTGGRPNNYLPSRENDTSVPGDNGNSLSMYADRTAAAGQPAYDSVLAFPY